jgi:hypothetical protein
MDGSGADGLGPDIGERATTRQESCGSGAHA